MYAITTLEGALLALVFAMVAAGWILGVLRLFPRATRTLVAGVECPVVHRRGTVELGCDEWTRRPTDVTRCSVLGGSAVALCRRSCLREVRRSPRFTRS
jgi:hypothetical protein